MRLQEIVEQLEFCHFECEGGSLESNAAFQELKRLAEHREILEFIEQRGEKQTFAGLTGIQHEVGEMTFITVRGWSDEMFKSFSEALELSPHVDVDRLIFLNVAPDSDIIVYKVANP